MSRKTTYQIEITTNYSYSDPLKLSDLISLVAEKCHNDVRRVEVKKVRPK